MKSKTPTPRRVARPLLPAAWCVLALPAVAGSAAGEPAAAAGRVRFDFEAGDLQGWTVVEGAFAKLVCEPRDVRNGQGRLLLTTLQAEREQEKSDGMTGVVESPVFTLRAPEMAFRVGGGRHPTTYVALCTLDGREHLRASGKNAVVMQEVAWKAPTLVGQKVFLRVVDRHTGGWGHVTFDDFAARGEIDAGATRARARAARLAGLPTAPLRAAIRDLAETFGARYPRAADYLARLERIEAALGGDPAKVRADLAALQREALVANPLVSGRPLLFVVRNQYKPDHHNTETMFQTGEINTGSFQGGGALKTLDLARGGATRTLWESTTGIARDPDVHFDGCKVLFSMRKDIQDDYHLYEVHADGSGLKPLTRAPGVFDIDPIYLPDDGIVFTSSREPKFCMCNRHIMGNLFRMDADGANIRQIGKSTLFEGHAALLPDGRILYDRWEYVDRNFGDAQGLWTVNPDGTNHAIYWGNNTGSPGAVLEGRPIPGTLQVLCTFSSCHDRPWGALAIVDRDFGLDGRPPVLRTWPADAAGLVDERGGFDDFKRVHPKHEDPFPLSDAYFLCSRATGEGERMGIFLLDVFGNELLLHVEGPGCYDPMPLGPRPRSPVVPERRDYANGEGYFYVADVYAGTHMQGVRRGDVKALRVVESPEKRFWTKPAWGGQGQEAPAMGWHDFNSKRILGTVPVEADGSAAFAVPSDRFVYFQLLDADGMMVQSMRSGTMVQSNEWTGCVGCHDERRTAPPGSGGGAVPLALRRSPSRLAGWHGPAREFSYRAEVQPIFDRACVSCHDFGSEGKSKVILAGDRELAFNASYIELWRKQLIRPVGAGPAQVQPARSWGSHASRRVEVIRKGHYDVRLGAEDVDRIVTWIDINAPYYPSYASAHPGNLAGRAPLDGRQLKRLEALTGAPLSKLADHKRRLGPQIAFDRPERSPCLAGLAERDAPAYREALVLIAAGRDELRERPEPDAPGFEACEDDRRRDAKYARLLDAEMQRREALREGRKVYDAPDRPPDDTVEGESARILKRTGGVIEVQSDDRWSGGQQLWWRDGRPGDRLELALPVARAGTYTLAMNNTRAFDYGIFQFSLDGEKLGGAVDLYSRENHDRTITLGTHTLKAGEHVFAAEIVGANPDAAKRHMLGLEPAPDRARAVTWPDDDAVASRIPCDARPPMKAAWLLSAAALPSAAAPPAPAEPPRPNFVIFFTDDQGYNDVGCFGSPSIKTPHLDRMAREGMRFTDFYVASPVCGPSRAGLMTGSYPLRVAEPGNRKHLHTVVHPKEILLPEVLKTAGYATGLVGKWHLAGELRKDGAYPPELMPNAQGFDFFYGTPLHNGVTPTVTGTSFQVQILRNREVLVDRLDQAGMDNLTKDYTDEAVRFITANRERPFFLYLAQNMPHVPLGASARFRGRSAGGLYGDVIEELDWSLGRILDTLKSLDLDEKTFVVFTSDNGPWVEAYLKGYYGSADPLRGSKMKSWEGGPRVPCIMRWPGTIPAGRDCREIVTAMDLYPTFARLAGAALPADRTIDGKDLFPLVSGTTVQGPHEAYFYYCYTHLHAVRQGKWKLVLPRPAKPRFMGWWARMIDEVKAVELYDLEADVGETRNVADQHPDVVARLTARVEGAREDLGDHDRVGKGCRYFDGDPPRERRSDIGGRTE